MSEVARLVGIAGCGKTTELLRLMEMNIDRGIDPHKIGFVTFTRAARIEAAERAASKFGISKAYLEKQGWFRTIHSVCYKTLNVRGELLTDNAESNAWLEDKLGERISVQRLVDEQNYEATYDGNSEAAQALNLWTAARVSLIPLQAMFNKTWGAKFAYNRPSIEKCFSIVRKYEAAKKEDDRMDFTDLLSQFSGVRHTFDGYEECTPRGNPPPVLVWFHDEAQDASPLSWRVFNRLINHHTVKWSYIVGDPYQSIFTWCGSDSRCFMNHPAKHERFMLQTYRNHQQVVDTGERMLSQVSGYGKTRNIIPAPHSGIMSFHEKSFSVTVREKLMHNLNDGWLILARTNFQARGLGRVLDLLGVPWVSNSGGSHWAAPKRNAAFGAIYNLEQNNPISGQDWAVCLNYLKQRHEGVQMLARGTKARFKEPHEQDRYDWIQLNDLLEVGATPHLIEKIRTGAWHDLFSANAREIVTAIEKWGVDVVMSPKVRVSTIHSAKGMEEKNVIYYNALTQMILDNMDRDSEYKLAYVAATRAINNLYIVSPQRDEDRGRILSLT